MSDTEIPKEGEGDFLDDYFKKRDEEVKRLGITNMPYMLNDKPFDELYDIALKQMHKGKQPRDTAAAFIPRVIKEFKDVGLDLQIEPDSDSFDASHMFNCIYKSLGKILATHPSVDVARDISKRLNVLYDAAQDCEKKVVDFNDSFKKKYASLLHTMDFDMLLDESSLGHHMAFSVTEHSVGVRGCKLLFDGYSDPDQSLSLDNVTRDFYNALIKKDSSRLYDLIVLEEQFVKGVGQLIRENYDDSMIWKINLFNNISSNLRNEYEYWSRHMDDEKEDDRIKQDFLYDHDVMPIVCNRITLEYLKGRCIPTKYGSYDLTKEQELKQRTVIDALTKVPEFVAKANVACCYRILDPKHSDRWDRMTDAVMYLVSIGADVKQDIRYWPPDPEFYIPPQK